tara:strand:- start:2 stop:829 length:828 start_codon:yes stop_codon:yes gene_type:complete
MNVPLFPDLIVNGELVPHAQVAAEVQNHDAPPGKPGIAWRKAANALAVRTLLLQEARRAGLSADPRQVAPGQTETPEEALIRGLLESRITVDTPDKDAVRAEWLRRPDQFRAPPLWEVSHILIACDPRDDAGREAAGAKARALAAQALAHPRGFADLARQSSDCGSKSNGGALGQIGPGDTVPEFEAALRDMTGGQITADPVLTRHGWHVIRMDAMAEGAPLPFDAVRDKIAAAMEKAEWARQARALVDTLVAGAEISGATLNAAKPQASTEQSR